ncbi:MAG: hypothetical protein LQ343_002400 [Gyalolechia ehrenbergii]|nr:MAG: hypothetical protein LQ343_002400 [Gyalolechia ehrenbergii]
MNQDAASQTDVTIAPANADPFSDAVTLATGAAEMERESVARYTILVSETNVLQSTEEPHGAETGNWPLHPSASPAPTRWQQTCTSATP